MAELHTESSFRKRLEDSAAQKAKRAEAKTKTKTTKTSADSQEKFPVTRPLSAAGHKKKESKQSSQAVLGAGVSVSRPVSARANLPKTLGKSKTRPGVRSSSAHANNKLMDPKYKYLKDVEQRVKTNGAVLPTKAQEALNVDQDRTPASALRDSETTIFREMLMTDLKLLFESQGLLSTVEDELVLIKLLHSYKLHNLTELRAWWENWGATGGSTLSVLEDLSSGVKAHASKVFILLQTTLHGTNSKNHVIQDSSEDDDDDVISPPRKKSKSKAVFDSKAPQETVYVELNSTRRTLFVDLEQSSDSEVEIVDEKAVASSNSKSATIYRLHFFCTVALYSDLLSPASDELNDDDLENVGLHGSLMVAGGMTSQAELYTDSQRKSGRSGILRVQQPNGDLRKCQSSSYSAIKVIWTTILNVESPEMQRNIQAAAIKVLLSDESTSIGSLWRDKIVTSHAKGSRVLKKLLDSNYGVVCGELKQKS